MKRTFRMAAPVLSAVILAATLGLAQAQLPIVVSQVQADLDDPVMEMQPTPEFEASKVNAKRTERSREWLEIELPFKLESDSQIGIVPEITIQYYFGVRGPGNTTFMLSDAFTYQNVPDDEMVYSIVYVSPPSLARIAGGMGEFDIRSNIGAWGVEILHNGRVVAAASSAGRDPWWNAFTGPRVPGFLMPKEKTPYQMLWIDRHVELKQN